MAEHLLSNEFGTIYKDRVSFNSKKGWFSGGTSEDLPMRHVTSVRLETKRNIVGGIIVAVVGLLLLVGLEGAGKIGGLILLAWAVLMLVGSPKVVLNTAGGDLRPAIGAPWNKSAAEAFVSAVKRALFDA